MSLLALERVSKTFQTGGMLVQGQSKKAVNQVSFTLEAGETLAIVGESGSGKSTTARLAMRLIDGDEGGIYWNDSDVSMLNGKALRQQRSHIQMVFQDPFASLNPRMRIWHSVAEGLRVHRPEMNAKQRKEAVEAVLQQCGIAADSMERYPHQFSGGQRQRIGIARALIVEPKVLVLDEPVSALDVSVQAQILNLLKQLQQSSNLAYLFISHDLSVVQHIADRVLVMLDGTVVEEGNSQSLFQNPEHTYTRDLLAARPMSHPSERL